MDTTTNLPALPFLLNIVILEDFPIRLYSSMCVDSYN